MFRTDFGKGLVWTWFRMRLWGQQLAQGGPELVTPLWANLKA